MWIERNYVPAEGKFVNYESYQRWTQERWAMAPRKMACLMALPAGAFFGLFMGVFSHSVLMGVANGLFFGVAMGICMAVIYRRMASRAFAGGASGEDRLSVIKAVHNGEPAPQHLADAVMRYADEVIAQWEGKMAIAGRVMLRYIGPAISAVFLVGSVVIGSYVGVGLWTVVLSFYVYQLVRMPKAWAKSVERARTAKDLARQSVAD